MKRETIFSPCRRYRFTLWRDWSSELVNGNFYTPDPHLAYHLGTRETFVQFIGLNPSTADEVQDDPTIRRCIAYAKQWGFGALCMTNVFAYRATDPEVMKAQPFPIGQGNSQQIVEVALKAGLVVCAWGKHGNYNKQGTILKGILQSYGVKLHHLGLNGDGTPKHPLYLRKDITPSEWR